MAYPVIKTRSILQFFAIDEPNGVVSVNGAPTVTLGTIRNANPDLKWEVKRTFNDRSIVRSPGFFGFRISFILLSGPG